MIGINSMRAIVVSFIGIFAAIWMCVHIISDDTNVFSESAIYLGVIFGLISLYSPKIGLYFLIFLGCYLDFYKRLIVLSVDQSFLDVTKVLAISPICALGTYLGMFGRIVFKQFEFKRFDFIVFSIATLVAVLFVIVNRKIGFLGAIQAGVQYACFIPIVCVIKIIIKTPKELEDLVKWIIGMFIPVGIYGLVQSTFGYADFERQYLLSGYTSTYMNLYEKYPRPFSTMNSTGSYCVMMGILTVFSFSFFRYLRSKTKFNFLNWGYFILGIFFMGCTLFSIGRVGYLLIIIGIPLSFIFLNRKLTVLFYSTGFIAYSLLIFYASEVFYFFDRNQFNLISSNSKLSRIFEVGTYGDRLWSFRNITENKKFHTLFGNSFDSTTMESMRDKSQLYHELMGEILYRFGIFGAFTGLIFIGATVYLMHMSVFRIRFDALRILSTSCLAMFVSLLVSSALVANLLPIYPINFYLYFLLGLIFCICKIDLRSHGK